jgi:predicted nucleotidyltransferase
MLSSLCNFRSLVFEEMARAAFAMTPFPVKVIVFGSVARGESDAESDIDVLLIAPTGALETDEWTSSVIEWTDRVSRFAASTTEVTEVDERQWQARSVQSTFWHEIEQDGVTVFSLNGADA